MTKLRSPRLAFTATLAAATVVMASWFAFFAMHAYAWSDFDAVGVDCDIFPAGEGLSAANWGTQWLVQTANNSGQDCDLMYVSGYARDSSNNYTYHPGIWTGFAGPAYNGFGDVVEVYGSHNICQSGYTHCNGYESTLIYEP